MNAISVILILGMSYFVIHFKAGGVCVLSRNSLNRTQSKIIEHKESMLAEIFVSSM